MQSKQEKRVPHTAKLPTNKIMKIKMDIKFSELPPNIGDRALILENDCSSI